jgi:hypothetical protein
MYLEAAIRALKKLDRDHMLPDGVPSSNEFLAGKDPLHSHETCDISDYTWTLSYMLMATGDAAWADKLERAVFNAGLGAISKDFKNLQYFSGVNQVIATGNSNNNGHAHGSTWMAYWPCHETECCAGNVHRFMPNYVARMWMQDRGGGLVAALYGPSVERYNENCVVTESTAYPFDEEVNFAFAMAKPEQMTFSFRIPSWCARASVLINGERYSGALEPGTFVTVRRLFHEGDQVRVLLPMDVWMRQWERYGVYVERGPLLYAFPVPEKVTIDTARYANLGSKRSPDPAFPALDIRPAGAWNYALRPGGLRVVKETVSGYPFDEGSVPVKILAPARRVEGWGLQEGRYTPVLPLSGVEPAAGKDTVIRLVPYGCTRLRVTVFPKGL